LSKSLSSTSAIVYRSVRMRSQLTTYKDFPYVIFDVDRKRDRLLQCACDDEQKPSSDSRPMKPSCCTAILGVKTCNSRRIKLSNAFIAAAAFVGHNVLGKNDRTSDASTPPVQPTDLVQQVGPPGDGVYAATETGPHHRRWAQIRRVPLEDGSSQT